MVTSCVLLELMPAASTVTGAAPALTLTRPLVEFASVTALAPVISSAPPAPLLMPVPAARLTLPLLAAMALFRLKAVPAVMFMPVPVSLP